MNRGDAETRSMGGDGWLRRNANSLASVSLLILGNQVLEKFRLLPKPVPKL